MSRQTLLKFVLANQAKLNESDKENIEVNEKSIFIPCDEEIIFDPILFQLKYHEHNQISSFDTSEFEQYKNASVRNYYFL